MKIKVFILNLLVISLVTTTSWGVPTLKQPIQPAVKGRPPAGQLNQFTSAPAMPSVFNGPPPQLFHAAGIDPTTHSLSWQATKPAAATTIYRRDYTSGAWVLISKNVTTASNFTDTAVLPVTGTAYKIILQYTDGTFGTAETFHKPVAAEGIKEIYAKQEDNEGVISIWWKPSFLAKAYRIFGPGQPAEGTLINGTIAKLQGVPRGQHTYNVMPEYSLPLPYAPKTPVNITVLPRTARYRVTINGVKVVQQTQDNALQLDGKGDEIYIAARTMSYSISKNLSNYNYQSSQLVRTPVYGDTNGFRDRVQAGSASSKGGIVSGDLVPPSAGSYSTNPSTSYLPIVVWEGTLTYNKDVLIVIPTIWEWDGKADQYNSWVNLWLTKVTSGFGIPDRAIRSLIGAPQIQRGILFYNVYGGTGVSASDSGSGYDRPIGLVSNDLQDRGYALSQELLERTFLPLHYPRTVISESFEDIVNSNGSGHYIMYLQIERLP